MYAKNVSKLWFLKDFNFFGKLDKKSLLAISRELELVSVSRGSEFLLRQKNEGVIFFLKSGTVKVVSEYNKHTKEIIKAGNVFGELNLIEEELSEKNLTKEVERAVALEDVVLYSLKVSQMKKIVSRHDALKDEIINLYGAKVKRLEKRLEDFMCKDGRTRIKEYIFNYLLEFGIREDNVLEAKKILSHSDIAHLTCTSRQTVSNVMSALRKEGLINYDSKRIYIAR